MFITTKYFLIRTRRHSNPTSECMVAAIPVLFGKFPIFLSSFQEIASEAFDHPSSAIAANNRRNRTEPDVEQRIDYLLKKLTEECSELIKESQKTQAFGLFFGNPKTGVSNLEALQSETCDVLACIEELSRLGVQLIPEDSKDRIEAKITKMYKWKAVSDNVKAGLPPEPLDDYQEETGQVPPTTAQKIKIYTNKYFRGDEK